MEELEVSEINSEDIAKIRKSVSENDWFFFVGSKEDMLDTLSELEGE